MVCGFVAIRFQIRFKGVARPWSRQSTTSSGLVRVSSWRRRTCAVGLRQPHVNASVWPYVAGHIVLLAPLLTVEVFREIQWAGVLVKDHTIGFTDYQDWRELATSSLQDIAVAAFQLEGQLGWYADPSHGVDGLARTRRRPSSAAVQTFGLNRYETGFVSFDSTCHSSSTSFLLLAHDEVKAAPEGKYDPGEMMCSYSFFSEMQKAIEEDGVNVMGCVAWSATDNCEWEKGYSKRFGVNSERLPLRRGP